MVSQVAQILVSVNVLAAMVWTGGMVAVTVATVAARGTLDAEQQVRFFRALGRRYAVVAGAALALFAATGLALAGDPAGWTTIEAAVAALTALVALLTVVGVRNARAVQRLRATALTGDEPETERQLRGARRNARALRALIALSTLAAILVATA